MAIWFAWWWFLILRLDGADVSITGDALFIGLLIMGMFFMMFANRRQNILVSLVTFMIWFSLGLWLFFSTSAPIGFEENEVWKDVLGWGFLVLAFLPFLFAMDQQIEHEAHGKKWFKYGTPPEIKGPTNYEKYRDVLWSRTRRGR